MGGTVSNSRPLTYLEADKIISNLFLYLNVPCEKVWAVGSYRRMEAFVNDIDILLIPKDKAEIANLLEGLGYRIHNSGNCKAIFLFSGNPLVPDHQLDLYFAGPIDFEAQALRWTGSKQFNILCSGRAKSKGLKLNQYGLFNPQQDDLLVASSESGILKVLGMEEYNDPKKRSL